MKKKLIIFFALYFIFLQINSVSAAPNSDVVDAIKLYKAGNYSGCYQELEKIVAEDPGNSVAYYYLALSAAQIGKKGEAISNYERVINLAPQMSTLSRYATRGKMCIEDPEKCNSSLSNTVDDFIFGKYGAKFSEEAKNEYEKLRIENLMREMNRSNDLTPKKFEGFKDYSSMETNITPNNDEIVAALRTLQKAGLSNIISNNNSMDLSMFNTNTNEQDTMLNLLGNSSNLNNPQLIQALFNKNMTLGF